MNPKALHSCMTKIFQGGRGDDTFKTPSPVNNFCLYPPPVLRCFWKDPLMTSTTPLQASFTATPSPSTTHSPPLKILIIHLPAQAFLPRQSESTTYITGQSQRISTHIAVPIKKEIKRQQTLWK